MWGAHRCGRHIDAEGLFHAVGIWIPFCETGSLSRIVRRTKGTEGLTEVVQAALRRMGFGQGWVADGRASWQCWRGQKWLDLRSVLKVELTGFADGLTTECVAQRWWHPLG